MAAVLYFNSENVEMVAGFFFRARTDRRGMKNLHSKILYRIGITLIKID